MGDVAIYGAAPHGRIRYSEIFPVDRLHGAIARLYERYAEGRADGPSRERAVVTARAVGYMLLPGKTSDLDALYAPSYKDVDHRVVGYGELSREEARSLASSFDDIAEKVQFRIHDV